MENSLKHYGILGMKWGKRRYQNSDGTLTEAGKKRYDTGEKTSSSDSESSKSSFSTSKTSKKSIDQMSNEELQTLVNRLKLENSYIQEVNSLNSNKSKGTKSNTESFIKKTLNKSAENIATQATNYVLGTFVNETIGKTIFKDDKMVNPKKGQKDK